MHTEVVLQADKLDSQINQDLDARIIDSYLNRGILRWLKKRYGYSREEREGFETNQQRIDELSSLHIKSPEEQPRITPTPLSATGIFEVPLVVSNNYLKYDYLHLTRARIDISSNDCVKRVVYNNKQTDDRDTFYDKPSFKWGNVRATFGRSSIQTDESAIYFDSDGDFDIDYVYLDYLKLPRTVFIGGYDHINGDPDYTAISGNSFDCDIDPGFHEEIVEAAVLEIKIDLENQVGYKLQKSN